jgi:type IX secretion system PorP/SprF family membrane protein
MKLKRFLYILILCLFCFYASLAQHQSVYSNYLLNMTLINPAAIGKDMALDVNVGVRKQWSGFSGSPSTNYVSVNSMMKRPTLNLGLMVLSDKIAVNSKQSIYGQYAFRIKFNKFKMAFGVQAGVQFQNNDLAELKRAQEVDAVIDQNQVRTVNLVVGTGVYIHNNFFFFGLSSPSLYGTGGNYGLNATSVLTTAGLVLKVRNKGLIKPSLMLRQVKGSAITTDINMTYYFQSKYGIGFSYRLKTAFVLLLEAAVNNQFKIAYCYDYSLGSISKYQNGSHEISLRFLFAKQYNIKNPRAIAN